MEKEFQAFLQRGGRSASAQKRIMTYLRAFERFLREERIWALAYYFEFMNNQELHEFARILRAERITRRAFPLREFRGLQPDDVEKMNQEGITNVK